MGIALFAWLLHVAALALAPLSLVQAVLSGGLVFLTVLAERVFSRLQGRQGASGSASGTMAVGLVLLVVDRAGAPAAHTRATRTPA